MNWIHKKRSDKPWLTNEKITPNIQSGLKIKKSSGHPLGNQKGRNILVTNLYNVNDAAYTMERSGHHIWFVWKHCGQKQV